jgi:putative protein-disulfide isomerase
MSTTITYLFDPLCGWCYGASPAIQRLGNQSDIRLELAPTGLFSGRGARAMDATFAAYAWSNDERIERLTGQRFTEAYRTQVLNKARSSFDSTTATLALTAVALTAPEQELATLKLLQEARYVHALDTSTVPVAEQLLRDAGLSGAAERLVVADAALLAANLERIRQAQALMQSFGAQGVPAVVVADDRGSRLLRGNALYGSFGNVLDRIAAA